MYVTAGTSKKQILIQIENIENELNTNSGLSAIDRIALRDELDYLYSFVNNSEEV